MRIASLEPFITELLSYLGVSNNLVGISHDSKAPEERPQIPRITVAGSQSSGDLWSCKELSRSPIDLTALRIANPDCIVAAVYPSGSSAQVTPEELMAIRSQLASKLGHEVQLVNYAPQRLEEIYEGSAHLMRELKLPQRGNDLGQRAKAQLMDYGDNFYERMKNKKVTFLSGSEPLTLAGLWIPDMIQVLSAQSQLRPPALANKVVSWDEILAFKPDVIVVAPVGATLKESMAVFKKLEKLNDWESLPAVKRGEVVFCDGSDHFYSPGPKIISSFGLLVSAIAGLESGYITPRDSFYRLRWLEMQRHRI